MKEKRGADSAARPLRNQKVQAFASKIQQGESNADSAAGLIPNQQVQAVAADSAARQVRNPNTSSSFRFENPEGSIRS
jgi:hypothetical protein